MRWTRRIAPRLSVAVLIAWCLPLIPAGCQDPAAIGGPDALGQPPDSGLAPDAAVSPDAAPAPDAGACEPMPYRIVYPCLDFVGNFGHWPYPDGYQQLDGCEGQPWFFQDDLCLGWMLGQICPDLAVEDIADLDSETVVIVKYDGHCMPEVCSLLQCTDGVELSIQSYCSSGTQDVRVASFIIVIPKTAQDEIVIKCYDGIRARCSGGVVWGDPTNIGNNCS